MKKIIGILVVLLSPCVWSDDSSGAYATIDKMYVYDTSIIVVQGNNSTGTANCENNNKWGLYWSFLPPEHADRIYSTLLAAYMSKTKTKPIFHSSECGPENTKKFIGKIVVGE
jgi:hypothetical protein